MLPFWRVVSRSKRTTRRPGNRSRNTSTSFSVPRPSRNRCPLPHAGQVSGTGRRKPQ